MHPSIIASILTALVTIVVLAGNNAYQKRKERRLLLSTKLEKLYSHLTELETTLHSSTSTINALTEKRNRLIQLVHQPHMIISLYFKTLEEDFLDIYESIVTYSESAQSVVNSPGFGPGGYISDDSVSYLNSHSSQIYNSISNLRLRIQKEISQLTEEDASWYF